MELIFSGKTPDTKIFCYPLQQISKIMKLVMFLLTVLALHVNAKSYSQTIILHTGKITVETALNKVTKQIGYSFIGERDVLRNAPKISLSLERATLAEALDQCLKGLPLTYAIEGKIVVLKRKAVVTQRTAALLSNSVSMAADTVIHGRVTDSTDTPLAGVSVRLKGTTIGTITQANGDYSLSLPSSKGTLVFSFVGYESKETAVNGRTTINITLSAETTGLDQLVVVGYGTERKVDLTGSVATKDAAYLKDRPITSSSQALQGINGLYVNQETGQPGHDNATIRLRGIGTLNNNDPLVLVDGVEYDLNAVNPNDIESISVLKDAASAAIYGSRAANGVILITTKKGNGDGTLHVELSSYYGVQKATLLPDVVSNAVDYMHAQNQAYINEGLQPPFSDAQLEEYKNGTDPDIYPNTNWFDVMFSTAPIHQYYLRTYGGTKKVDYSFSVGYVGQKGVLMGTRTKKYSLNTNINFRPTEKLEIGVLINGNFRQIHGPYVDVNGQGDDTEMGAINRALPVDPTILSNGEYGTTWLTIPGHNVFRHPIARAIEGGKDERIQDIMVGLHASYTLPFNIQYKVNISATKNNSDVHSFTPQIFLYTPKNPGVTYPNGKDIENVSDGSSYDLNTTFFQTLSWDKSTDGHNIKLLLGSSAETFYNSGLNGHIEGFLDNELQVIDAGTTNIKVGGDNSESKLASYFGRVNYNFREKYLFEANLRADGSSRFASNKRWGYFPSVSAGWRISEEKFMQRLSAVDNLKIRFSIGKLGNQNIPLFSYLSQINLNNGYTFNGNPVSGAAITSLADPAISWEATTTSDLGLDLGLWNNKFSLTVDAYNKLTSGILARITIPAQVGNLGGPITNFYKMSNKGLEIQASYQNAFDKFQYKIGGDIAFNNNKVVFLNGEEQFTTNGFGNVSVIKEGYPVNSWYLYEATGIFKNDDEVKDHATQAPSTGPGDIIYRDVNKDGKIDENDMRIIGRTVPKYTYAFNLDLEYKRIYLTAIFQGVQGVDIYRTGKFAWALFNGAGLTKYELKNAWSPDNPNGTYPKFNRWGSGSGVDAQNSTFWLEDASYLRLKNLQLGYTLPPALTRRANINDVKVYLNAQNLLTLTKLIDNDPETDVLLQNDNVYPNIKVFTIGCNITF